MLPPVLMRPIVSLLELANHNAPSGPEVMPMGPETLESV